MDSVVVHRGPRHHSLGSTALRTFTLGKLKIILLPQEVISCVSASPVVLSILNITVEDSFSYILLYP